MLKWGRGSPILKGKMEVGDVRKNGHWKNQILIIMSKPPALPGDTQSLTFSGI
jgi:hypothetical protein